MNQPHLYLQLGTVVLAECVKMMVAQVVLVADLAVQVALGAPPLLVSLIKLATPEHLCILL